METGIVIIIGIFIVLFFIILSSILGKKKPKLAKENIPSGLGINHGVPLENVINSLETALDKQYIEQVKQRFLSEDSKRTEDEFEWLLFELKRYFILTKILKSAPMFSEDVDEVWHEMILFTKDYQSFSDRYYGNMLHHIPNTNPEPAPQERAFFDWIFSQLFSITEFTWKSWGNFFRHPLHKDMLDEFRTASHEELINKYFKNNDENKTIITYLIDQMKKQLDEANIVYQRDPKGHFDKQRTYGNMTTLSLVMVFYSYFYFDEYWHYAEMYTYATASSTTSGCSSAVFCGVGSDSNGNDHGDSGGDSGGSDGGGSSCSSCGGGCSS